MKGRFQVLSATSTSGDGLRVDEHLWAKERQQGKPLVHQNALGLVSLRKHGDHIFPAEHGVGLLPWIVSLRIARNFCFLPTPGGNSVSNYVRLH
jgi:hypothetical protein